MDNATLQGLRQAKEELKEKILHYNDLRTRCNGLGIGTRIGTIAGTGGELEAKLSPIPNRADDSCVRIYLREMPPSEVILPSTYRGVYLGYVVIGRILVQ